MNGRTRVLALMLVGAAAFVGLCGIVSAGGKTIGDPYTLDTCPVSGKKIGPGATVAAVNEREVRFCCGFCVTKFKADSKQFFAKIDAAIVKQQAASYPLDICLMMGETLKGDGAEPVDFVYGNRLFRLCCDGCSRGIRKDPAKAFKKLDDAVIAKQAKNYPLKTCAVSGEALGDGAKNVVVANQLIKICCGGCEKSIKQNPAKFLAMKANAAAKSKMVQ